MPPTAKAVPSGSASQSAWPPTPPPPPSAPAAIDNDSDELSQLANEVVCPGSYPAEPLSVTTEGVTQAVIDSFDQQALEKLDLLTSGPFLYSGRLAERVCYKQESNTHDPAGGLCLFWCKDEGNTGWYIAYKPFLYHPDPMTKDFEAGHI